MSTECEFTIASDTNVMLLIPNHGSGSYSGGGGLFFIGGTDYTNYATQVPFLILGGGGGGYNNNNDWSKPGTLQTGLFTTTRRGPSRGASGDYDGGAAWKNDYTPTVHGGGVSPARAKHFVQGGKGGTITDCGAQGGFGGGGGSCPGGGGGLQGGYPGDNNHDGGSGYGGSQSWSGGQHGGGGGTSYYRPDKISNITNTSYGSSRGGGGSQLNSEDSNHQGYFGIYTVYP